MINRTTTALLSLALCAASVQAAETVSIANWSGYIAPDTLAQFTQRTAIQTTYDVIDSNETTEAKLMTGGSGYDLASPCLLYTSPSPRDVEESRMPSSA